MLTQCYRKIIPSSIRHKIYKLFLGKIVDYFRKLPARAKGWRICLFSPFYPKNEYYDAYRFLGRHGWTPYPDRSFLKYKNYEVSVWKDELESLLYVIHKNKPLYFPRHFSASDVKDCYRSLLIEQDPENAHCYLGEKERLKGKILFDIGAAEGILALNVIDDVNAVYFFECEEKWIEALHATFKPWKEKVHIINKYVGDRDEGNSLTIDTLFSGSEAMDNLYIKMDIEGAELPALRGAEKLLTQGENISLAVCTYHKAQDVIEIPAYLESLGYECVFTDGLLFFENEMRRAVCRAHRKNMELKWNHTR